MMSTTTSPPWAGTTGILSRGVLTGGAIGMAIGGVAGTASWPVVGTFFGAVAGVMAGMFTGGSVGLALVVTAHQTQRPIAQRVVGTATAVIVIGMAHLAGLWSATSEPAPTAFVVVALIVISGLAAPVIVNGIPAADSGRTRLPDALGRTMVFGTGIGAVMGGLVGFGIGLQYLPTSPVAAVEGAILGGVSGCVLSLVVCAGIVAKASVGRRGEIEE